MNTSTSMLQDRVTASSGATRVGTKAGHATKTGALRRASVPADEGEEDEDREQHVGLDEDDSVEESSSAACPYDGFLAKVAPEGLSNPREEDFEQKMVYVAATKEVLDNPDDEYYKITDTGITFTKVSTMEPRSSFYLVKNCPKFDEDGVIDKASLTRWRFGDKSHIQLNIDRGDVDHGCMVAAYFTGGPVAGPSPNKDHYCDAQKNKGWAPCWEMDVAESLEHGWVAASHQADDPWGKQYANTSNDTGMPPEKLRSARWTLRDGKDLTGPGEVAGSSSDEELQRLMGEQGGMFVLSVWSFDQVGSQGWPPVFKQKDCPYGDDKVYNITFSDFRISESPKPTSGSTNAALLMSTRRAGAGGTRATATHAGHAAHSIGGSGGATHAGHASSRR
ncbi:unnamed protein product [Amoebophrya sp. A120]|nr:unnamed protein product [Amoebophrya sp. A120]|eukprot:GSA120T00012478001.1